jgi:chromosome segregation ATPase
VLWFQFPENQFSVSVHQQTFEPEVRDAKGIGFFRAPEVFREAILDLPGFEQRIPKIDLKAIETKQHIPALQARIDILESDVRILQTKLRDAGENLNIAKAEIHELKIKLNRVGAR